MCILCLQMARRIFFACLYADKWCIIKVDSQKREETENHRGKSTFDPDYTAKDETGTLFMKGYSWGNAYEPIRSSLSCERTTADINQATKCINCIFNFHIIQIKGRLYQLTILHSSKLFHGYYVFLYLYSVQQVNDDAGQVSRSRA